MNTKSYTTKDYETFAELKFVKTDNSQAELTEGFLKDISTKNEFIPTSLDVLDQSNSPHAHLVATNSIRNLLETNFKTFNVEMSLYIRDRCFKTLENPNISVFSQNLIINLMSRAIKFFYDGRDKPHGIFIESLLLKGLQLPLSFFSCQAGDIESLVKETTKYTRIFTEIMKEWSTPVATFSTLWNKKKLSKFRDDFYFEFSLYSVKLIELIALINSAPIEKALMDQAILMFESILDIDLFSNSGKGLQEMISLGLPIKFQALILPPREIEGSEGVDLVVNLAKLFLKGLQSEDISAAVRVVDIISSMALCRKNIFPTDQLRLSYLSKLMLFSLALIEKIGAMEREGFELLDLEQLRMKVFNVLLSIKTSYSAGDLLEVPFFWVFLDKIVSFTLETFEKVCFNDEKFMPLLKFWFKIASSIHFLYSSNKGGLEKEQDFLEKVEADATEVPHNDFILRNAKEPVFIFSEIVRNRPQINFNFQNQLNDSRKQIENVLALISKGVINCVLLSVEKSMAGQSLEELFPEKGSVFLNSLFPSIVEQHGSEDVLKNLYNNSNTLFNQYFEAISNVYDVSLLECKLAKLFDFSSYVLKASSSLGSEESQVLKTKFYEQVAELLVKSILLIEMKPSSNSDPRTQMYLDNSVVSLIKVFSNNFFDTNSALNYSRHIYLDQNFYNEVFRNVDSFRSYLIASEPGINLRFQYGRVGKPPSFQFDRVSRDPTTGFDNTLFEGILVRKCLSVLDFYKAAEAHNLIQNSILALETLLVVGEPFDKVSYLKERNDSSPIFGKAKYANLLLLGLYEGCSFDRSGGAKENFKKLSELSIFKSSEKKIQKNFIGFFAMIGELLFTKFGLRFFSTFMGFFDGLLSQLDTFGTETSSEYTWRLLILCYALRGLAVSNKESQDMKIFPVWFNSKCSSTLLRILETNSKEGQITSAIIKLFCSFSQNEARIRYPLSNTLRGGDDSCEEISLWRIRDATKTVSIISTAISKLERDNKIKEDTVSSCKYKPLSLLFRLLEATLSSYSYMFGAMRIYGDKSLEVCVELVLELLLASPFFEVMAHTKLFYSLASFNFCLVKFHMRMVCELGEKLISPLMAIVLEAVQSQNSKLRKKGSRTIFCLLEYRYANYCKPIWKVSENAQKLEEMLSQENTSLNSCFEAMMDNFVSGNGGKYPEFESTIFIMILNYPILIQTYKEKIVSIQKDEDTRQKVFESFDRLIKETDWEYYGEENLDDFALELKTFSDELEKLTVRLSED